VRRRRTSLALGGRIIKAKLAKLAALKRGP